jgi:uncharacterized protein
MRKQNQEITDPAILEEILSKSKICRLGIMDQDLPYVLPFNYGYRNKCIYIHSASEGKKIDLLKKNNKVCFEIEYNAEIVKDDKSCKWATKYRSIVGYSEVDIITDFEAKKQALDIIMQHNGSTVINIYEDKQVEAIVILKVRITNLTGKQSSNWIDN